MTQVVLVVTWAVVLFKAPGAWRRPATTPARRALWVAFLALALGWSVRLPWAYAALDHITGVPNLSQPVGDALALATGCAVVAMLLFQSTPDPAAARRKIQARVAALAVAVAAMALTFAHGSPQLETSHFVSHYAAHGFLFGYYLSYLSYLGYVFADLARLCRRYARLTDRRPLRAGMRLLQLAGLLGLLYVFLRAGYLVGVRAGYRDRLDAYERASSLLVAVLSLCAVVGASLPTAAARVETYRALRQLYPLWQALYRATPGIALAAPGGKIRERVDLRDLRFRLHSRIIEIRDGRLALRQYFRRDVARKAEQVAQAQGLTGEDKTAAVEAATLAAAVQDKTAGRPAVQDPILEPVAPGGADLAGELSFLRRVTRAYTHPRAVRRSARHDRS